jgi:hypothetical protein
MPFSFPGEKERMRNAKTVTSLRTTMNPTADTCVGSSVMSTSQAVEYAAVLEKVRSWPAEMRLTLAEQLLHSLHPEVRTNGRRGIPAEQVLGLAAGKGPPPDDETVKQWIHEHRLEKYG